MSSPTTSRPSLLLKSQSSERNTNESGDRAAAAAERWRRPGPFDVRTHLTNWLDDSRQQRKIPAKIYWPEIGKHGPGPLIVFSHGLGGTRQGYEYVGRHWASHGHVCVHVQHPGSDGEVAKGSREPTDALRRAAEDPANFINRPKDVSFAIDRMLALNADPASAFHGLIDADRIGVAGHSFGAFTAHLVCGRTLTGPEGTTIDLRDARVKACVAMSAPAKPGDALRQSYRTFRTPGLLITGTLDESVLGSTRAEDRRRPFDLIPEGDQFLLILARGDHMVFTGRPGPGRDATQDALIHDRIRLVTTAFWEAYLRDSAAARTWLLHDFQPLLADAGTFEARGL